MTYIVVHFYLTPDSEDAKEVLVAMASERGYEAFEECDVHLDAYIPDELFNKEELDILIAEFPFDTITINYSFEVLPDQDWNAQWEAEGFAPILIDSEIVVTDGRHLPSTPSPIMIEIDAKMAFGTGTHATTRMMIRLLRSLSPLQTKSIIDCGCGTGILGIAALKLGAERVIAYDIDEWSADNTRHNAVINHTAANMEILHGDASVLSSIDLKADIIMANINRNILLNDMPSFSQVMKHDGALLLSGVYESDVMYLEAMAKSLGMSIRKKIEEDGWVALLLTRF